MLPCEWLARGQADASAFQREKLQAAEEESRKAANTMQGKRLLDYLPVSFMLVPAALILMFSSLLELEQSVEQSKKDYQTLREESRCRESELRAQLTQVGVHLLSYNPLDILINIGTNIHPPINSVENIITH